MTKSNEILRKVRGKLNPHFSIDNFEVYEAIEKDGKTYQIISSKWKGSETFDDLCLRCRRDMELHIRSPVP
ncbi:hypothetical protein B6U83_00165 [Thermoplasmatales archaeon ex4484_36]|nr:MAG: hypothetical protein B6U83_00165 [Thermoplasmatales archaeon ex4484_36]